MGKRSFIYSVIFFLFAAIAFFQQQPKQTDQSLLQDIQLLQTEQDVNEIMECPEEEDYLNHFSSRNRKPNLRLISEKIYSPNLFFYPDLIKTNFILHRNNQFLRSMLCIYRI